MTSRKEKNFILISSEILEPYVFHGEGHLGPSSLPNHIQPVVRTRSQYMDTDTNYQIGQAKHIYTDLESVNKPNLGHIRCVRLCFFFNQCRKRNSFVVYMYTRANRKLTVLNQTKMDSISELTLVHDAGSFTWTASV